MYKNLDISGFGMAGPLLRLARVAVAGYDELGEAGVSERGARLARSGEMCVRCNVEHLGMSLK